MQYQADDDDADPAAVRQERELRERERERERWAADGRAWRDAPSTKVRDAVEVEPALPHQHCQARTRQRPSSRSSRDDAEANDGAGGGDVRTDHADGAGQPGVRAGLLCVPHWKAAEHRRGRKVRWKCVRLCCGRSRRCCAGLASEGRQTPRSNSQSLTPAVAPCQALRFKVRPKGTGIPFRYSASGPQWRPNQYRSLPTCWSAKHKPGETEELGLWRTLKPLRAQASADGWMPDLRRVWDGDDNEWVESGVSVEATER